MPARKSIQHSLQLPNCPELYFKELIAFWLHKQYTSVPEILTRESENFIMRHTNIRIFP